MGEHKVPGDHVVHVLESGLRAEGLFKQLYGLIGVAF